METQLLDMPPAPPVPKPRTESLFNAGPHKLLFNFLKRRLGLSLFGVIRFERPFYVGNTLVTEEMMKRLAQDTGTDSARARATPNGGNGNQNRR